MAARQPVIGVFKLQNIFHGHSYDFQSNQSRFNNKHGCVRSEDVLSSSQPTATLLPGWVEQMLAQSRNILMPATWSSRETDDSGVGLREAALEFHPDELSLSRARVLLLLLQAPFYSFPAPDYPVRLQHIFMEALSRTRIISSTHVNTLRKLQPKSII